MNCVPRSLNTSCGTSYQLRCSPALQPPSRHQSFEGELFCIPSSIVHKIRMNLCPASFDELISIATHTFEMRIDHGHSARYFSPPFVNAHLKTGNILPHNHKPLARRSSSGPSPFAILLILKVRSCNGVVGHRDHISAPWFW
ncbi:hypothetical protein PoB_001767600 [Plakobranchus ocellatus]|uniref:Uncharacterized protein n=1 Tax=Plakobranchus ocellatus TaxID=259542 RepID=A0AAV3Z5L7_9GAST|nr:hypothetical protein PoB_001767600 [Plakobranchus ocellatus]